MHNVLRVQIFHPERRIHGYDEPLPEIRAPSKLSKKWLISCPVCSLDSNKEKTEDKQEDITCPSAVRHAEENR